MTSQAVAGSRRSTKVNPVIASGAYLSDAIDIRVYASGVVMMPAAWTTADLGIYVCDTEDGTFQPLLDSSGEYGVDVNIDGAAAGKSYLLPVNIFSAQYIKLWSTNGAGEDTNQEAERTFTVMLKS